MANLIFTMTIDKTSRRGALVFEMHSDAETIGVQKKFGTFKMYWDGIRVETVEHLKRLFTAEPKRIEWSHLDAPDEPTRKPPGT